jgi:hypothetical protein
MNEVNVLDGIDVSKPLKDQKKPDYVCEPGDPRVRKYGWRKGKFKGYVSIVEKTIWISSVWSLQPGRGNFKRMVKRMHNAGYEVKVPSPFPNMESICNHLGFERTEELFPEADEMVTVYVLHC